MGKLITIYRSYTAAQLKARASVPNQADMGVNSTTVDCTNITTTKVRNALAAAVNSVAALCNHLNVNHWSGFGPTIRTITPVNLLPLDDKVIVNSDPQNGGDGSSKLGDFAGYNHSAVTPGWLTGGLAAAMADLWFDNNTPFQRTYNVILGEVDYNISGHPAALGVTVSIWTSADVLVGWASVNLSNTGSTNVAITVNSSANQTQERTLYGRVHICDSYTNFASNGDNIICAVPNISKFTFATKIKLTTEWQFYCGSPQGQTLPANWSLVGSPPPATMNRTAGTMTLYDIESTQSYSNLKIVTRLFDWTWTQVGSDAVLFNQAYTAGQTVYGGVMDVGFPNIPATGYHFRIYFIYT